jgi:hypothetical protein
MTLVQRLVLGFLVVVLASTALILLVAPSTYAPFPPVAFLGLLAVLLGLLGLGVLKKSRWLFWLILVAFVAGVLRVPASVLELSGAVKAPEPAWYVALQGVIGLIQVGIAWVMWQGYRRGGYWANP